MKFTARHIGLLGVLLAIATGGMASIATGSAFASYAPSVETLPAKNFAKETATLVGRVDPEGAETTYHFQYGTTTSYGKETVAAILAPGTSFVEVTKVATGLLTGTTYHFRIVATNATGTSYGGDFSFVAGPINFEWKVKGAALKAGASKEVTLSTNGKFYFKATRYANTRQFGSTKLKLANGKILGGKPGKIEGTIELENTVMEKPYEEGCETESPTIVIGPLIGEIVESDNADKQEGGEGKTEIVFSPASGPEGYFTKYGLKQRPGYELPCPAVGERVTYYGGSLVVEVNPQLTEAKALKLAVTTTGFSKIYLNSAKQVGSGARGEYWAGQLALVGEPEAELVSKELFGAF